MPSDAGGSAASGQNEAGAEDRYCERPAPRERREVWRACHAAQDTAEAAERACERP